MLNSYYSATQEKPAKGGTYIEGEVGQPTFINPLIAQANEVDLDLIAIIFRDLLDLTENYKTSSNGKTWTIFLKKDLKWDDNHNLTADDVIFTIKTIQDPDSNSPLFSFWQGVIAEKLNDNELRFELKSPYIFFLDNLRKLRIAPKHIFSGIPTSNLKLSQYNLRPVGSGSYKFEGMAVEKNGFVSQVSLTTNPLYHGPQPFIDSIILKFYRSEEDLITDFNLKKISGFGGINPKAIKDLKIVYEAHNLNLPRYYAIFINTNINPILQEQKVRRALDLATNKKLIIKKVFNDYASIADGPIPSNLIGYDKFIYQDDVFDLHEATRILDNEGWLTNLEDNWRYKTINKNKQRLELEIIVPEIPFLIETVDIIKADWAKVGIKLVPFIIPITDINKEVIRTRNYQLLLFGNILSNNPDILSFWHSSERLYPGLNLALYNSKDADKLLENVRQDVDVGSRRKKLSQLQSIIHQDTPAIFLFNPNYLYITTNNLKGFNLATIATPANRFAQITDWHLNTERSLTK